LAYIFVADGVGLPSSKFVQWAPKDASFLQQSAFWPFKVILVSPPLWLIVLSCTVCEIRRVID